MPDGDLDTDRSVVKTYVPAYQKERWQRQADELGMSQSEFVRTMVQAGRRGFVGFDDSDAESAADGPATSAEGETGSRTDRDDSSASRQIDEHVLNELPADEHRSWDALRDALAAELVDEPLENALQRLQRQNRVEYSGRHGGYTLVTER